MSQAFDPYYTWLAIPPEEQPPDHYRLIGVRRFESNLDVISHAVDQRMAHLRTFQAGKHSAASQKLLNELSAASVVLLNPEKKSAYDEALHAKATKATQHAPPVKREPKPAPAPRKLPRAQPLEAIPHESGVAVAELAPHAEATPATLPDEEVVATGRPAWQNPLVLIAGGGGLAVVLLVALLVMAFGGKSPVKDEAFAVRPPDAPAPANIIEEVRPPSVTDSDTMPDDAPAPAVPPEPEQVAVAVEPVAEASAGPGIEASPATGRTSIDLLERVNLRQDVVRGGLTLDNGKLRTNGSSADMVLWPMDLPDTYELQATVVRLRGNDSLGLGVVIGGRQAMVAFDSFAGGFTGLHTINGQRQNHPQYPGAFRGPLLVNDRPAMLRVHVEKNQVTVWCDGRQVFAWSGDPAALSVDGAWRLPPNKPPGLFLASWDSAYEVSELKLVVPLPEEPIAVVQDVPPASSGQGKQGELKGELDLLAGIDLSKDVLRGRLLHENGKLRTFGNGVDLVGLGVDPPESYEVQATVTRIRGNDAIGLGIVVGGRRSLVGFDSFSGSSTGLDMIAGRRQNHPQYPGAFRGALLVNRRPATLRVRVEKGQVTAWCDGRQVFTWTGDPALLAVDRAWMLPSSMPPGLFLATWSSSYEIDELKLIAEPAPETQLAVNQPPAETQPAPASVTNPPTASPRKQTVPDAAAQKKALDELRQIFKDDFDRVRTPDDKANLARRLSQLAKETKDDIPTRFVLWQEAARLAAEGVQLPLAFSLLDDQAAEFEVDVFPRKAEIVKDLAPLARTPADRKQLAETALKLADEATAVESYDAADQLLRQAAIAAKLGDARLRVEIQTRLKELDEIRKQARLAQQAAERLKTEPDNPKANLAYGKYLCLAKGDWDQALPHLSKGDDEKLRTVAAADLAKPSEADKQSQLGDQWWDLAQAATAEDKPLWLGRAAYWYGQASSRLTGISKARVDKRLDEIKESVSARTLAGGRSRTIDLIALVDPSKDTIHGNWSVDRGELICSSQHFVPRIYLPYLPPEEYDIKVVFSQPKLRHEVCVILPKAGSSFAWRAGGTEGYFGFSIENPPGGRNPTESRFRGALVPNRQYTTIVQVRNEGVQAFFEGKLMAAYKTDYSDMKTSSWHNIQEKDRLAVGCDDPTVFHVIELTEVTGTGKPVRESK